VDETELVTSAAPRQVVAPAPTLPEEDAPRTLRRSSRNTRKADEHTLLKAERLAKKKNLEGISFSSFLDSRIISNLGRLANNTNTSGVVRIKNLEVDRLVVCANKINKVNANDLRSDDEREERPQEALNHAGGFLNESLFDAENDHNLDLFPISCKKKFNKAKKQKTGNLPKKLKTLQRLL
jgi:glycerol-3-phosphate dehydrogenase